jgi:hypothetical protein
VAVNSSQLCCLPRFSFLTVAWSRFPFAREMAEHSAVRVTALMFVTPRDKFFLFFVCALCVRFRLVWLTQITAMEGLKTEITLSL